ALRAGEEVMNEARQTLQRRKVDLRSLTETIVPQREKMGYRPAEGDPIFNQRKAAVEAAEAALARAADRYHRLEARHQVLAQLVERAESFLKSLPEGRQIKFVQAKPARGDTVEKLKAAVATLH